MSLREQLRRAVASCTPIGMQHATFRAGDATADATPVQLGGCNSATFDPPKVAPSCTAVASELTAHRVMKKLLAAAREDLPQIGRSDCRHLRRPGRSDGLCASGRDDLMPAYGDRHPLRRLPADGGEGCKQFELAKWVTR